MHKNALIFLVSSLLLTITSQAFAEAAVWKISAGNNHIYLGGTLHLLSASDHPLPAEYELAYQDASAVYFETDLNVINSPAFQARLMPAMMLKNGKTLPQMLKPNTYKQLSDFFSKRGMDITKFSLMKPAGVTLLLAGMEFQRLGMSPQAGVDFFYHQRASADKKRIGALETPDQQLAFVSNIGEGNEDQMVRYTLRDLNQASTVLQELKQGWRKGDLNALEKTGMADMAKEFPVTYKELLVDRNNQWLPQIQAQLKTPETELFLVGALHLVGKDGLLEQLKKKGFTLTQLKAAEQKTATPQTQPL